MCSRVINFGVITLRTSYSRAAAASQLQQRWPARCGYFSSAGTEKTETENNQEKTVSAGSEDFAPGKELSASRPEPAAGPADMQRLVTQVDKLNSDLEDLREKLQQSDDKYKRSLAENENMRKRFTKQVEDARLFGIQGFCKDLLEVADVLGKAMESVPPDQITDENPHLKSLFEGLRMTEAHLHQVFDRHSLTPINPLGEKFNPNQHEALFQQFVEGKTPGTVIVVSKIGYKLHERTIRPALVGVAKDM